jgi:membrane-bound lytic murein transglycosylase A
MPFSLLKSHGSNNRPLLKRIGLAMAFFSVAVLLLLLNSCSGFSPLSAKSRYGPAQNSHSKSGQQISSADKTASLDLPIVVQDDMDLKGLEQVIENQLAVLDTQNEFEKVVLEGLNLRKRDLKNSLNAFLGLLKQKLAPAEFNRRLREQFKLYKAGQGRDKKFLFTGYYTPVIPASPVKTEEYIYPLYRLPDDSPELKFINLKPSGNTKSVPRTNWKNYTREQIDRQGILKNQHLEIAWLKDDLERFFLHIQGSAFLRLPDGKLQSVGYAGANKYGYQGIGKLMVKDGLLSGKGERTMQGIKKYLRDHPEKIPFYLYQNKRYIFFSYNDAGPRGSGGGTLVGGRSLATDKSIYPAGGLALIFVRKPVLNRDNKITGWKRSFRFVVDQDTGSDIKGPGRADLFFGIGQRPGIMAGSFKEWGEVYYLIKKN